MSLSLPHPLSFSLRHNGRVSHTSGAELALASCRCQEKQSWLPSVLHAALFINNNKSRPPQGFTREPLAVLFRVDKHLSVANLQTPLLSVFDRDFGLSKYSPSTQKCVVIIVTSLECLSFSVPSDVCVHSLTIEGCFHIHQMKTERVCLLKLNLTLRHFVGARLQMQANHGAICNLCDMETGSLQCTNTEKRLFSGWLCPVKLLICSKPIFSLKLREVLFSPPILVCVVRKCQMSTSLWPYGHLQPSGSLGHWRFIMNQVYSIFPTISMSSLHSSRLFAMHANYFKNIFTFMLLSHLNTPDLKYA